MVTLLLFSEEENLKSYVENSGTDLRLIAPNPTIADLYRKHWSSPNITGVETIAKFMNGLLKSTVSSKLEMKRKADVKLLLGALYKMVRPEGSYLEFEKTFQLASELRSYTLDEAVIESVFEGEQQEEGQKVTLFYRLLKQMEIIDEPQAYELIKGVTTDELAKVLQQTLLLVGFDLLSPTQIDLLQYLSRAVPVQLAFYKDVYHQAGELDWIKWFSRFDCEIIEVDETSTATTTLEVTEFSHQQLNKAMRNLDFAKEQELVVCDSILKPTGLLDIPHAQLRYKIPIEFFANELQLIREELRDMGKTDLESFESYLLSRSDEAAKGKNFKLLKVIETLKQSFGEWRELSQSNTQVTNFEHQLFLESVGLNLPRTFLVPTNEGGLYVRHINSFQNLTPFEQKVFCATQRDPTGSGQEVFEYEVERKLATIGPIKRAQFEELILAAKIRAGLRQKGAKLFIQEGVIQESLFWSELLQDFKLEFFETVHAPSFSPNFNKIFPTGATNKNAKRISATALQSYIDCPRKYWLRYEREGRKKIRLKEELLPMELGIIEHEIIGLYLTQESGYEEQRHEELAYKVLTRHKALRDNLFKMAYLQKLLAQTKAAIVELLELKRIYGLELHFEKGLKRQSEARGSIDLWAMGDRFNLLIDFKRGGGGIPSDKGFNSFEKLQLWFYLQALKESVPELLDKPLVVGYFNLSDPQKSLVYSNEEEVASLLTSFSDKFFVKIKGLKLNEKLLEYESFEREQLNALFADQEFIANPITPETCNYCELKVLCSRGTDVQNR